jgi:hypothetical protein
MTDQVSASLTQERIIAVLAGFFGTLALLLAAQDRSSSRRTIPTRPEAIGSRGGLGKRDSERRAQRDARIRQPPANSTPANNGLPTRLMTAFEVAEFIGCHEETVRRAYLRGLLVSQRFGRPRKEVPRRRRPRLAASRGTDESPVDGKEGMYGCPTSRSREGQLR